MRRAEISKSTKASELPTKHPENRPQSAANLHCAHRDEHRMSNFATLDSLKKKGPGGGGKKGNEPVQIP